MWSCGPGAGEMLEVEGDGSALHAIKNLCLSGLSNSLGAALGGCHKSAHPTLRTGDDNQVGLKLFFTVILFFFPLRKLLQNLSLASPDGRTKE